MFREGYGWFVRKRFGRRVTAFGGRSPGFTASLERFIDDDACVIVLANTYALTTQTPIAADLAAIVRGENYSPPAAIRPVRVDPKTLEAYAGRYEGGADFFFPGALLTIAREDDHRLMQWSAGARAVLAPVSETEFLDRLFWARVIFTRNPNGEVTRLIWRWGKDYPARKLANP